MPVPKKRRSKSKQRIKKACWKIEMPALSTCPSCAALIKPHMVCPECGNYKGRKVITPKSEKPKKTKAE